MRILFVHLYYPAFLRRFYARETMLWDMSYDQHQRILLDELFGDADFYSDGVRAQGHEAKDVIANDEFLQKKWAKEHGIHAASMLDFLHHVKYVHRFFKPTWVEEILRHQIDEYNPDVLYFHDIDDFSRNFLLALKKAGRKIVAQKASPVSSFESYRCADLVFTSFPHFVDLFKKEGVRSAYLKLGFSDKVLKKIPPQEKKYECTFVGGLNRHHSKGVELLTHISQRNKIDFFGYGKEVVPKDSEIYKNHHGEVWGKDMYKIMMQSVMTLNRHINVAGEYANNMRLYEATGSGALLFTEEKKNIREMFVPGEEIVTYVGAEDLSEKIIYYSEHPEERIRIAQAGQARTLKDHTYTLRMKEALEIILAL